MRSDYLMGASSHDFHARLSDRELADALVEAAADVPDGLWLVRRQLEGSEHYALLARTEDILADKPDWHYLCAGPDGGQNAFVVFTVSHDHHGAQQVVMIGSFESLTDAVDAYNEPLLLFGIPPVDPVGLRHDLVERAIACRRAMAASGTGHSRRRRY
jgi:hypothetical protein